MVVRRKKTTARKQQPAPDTPTPEAKAATLPLRIRHEEPVVAVGKEAVAGFRRDWDRERVKAVLGDLAGRKRSLESLLFEVATSAQKAVTGALRETGERVGAEARLDAQYREQLVMQKPVRKARMSKTGYRVSGRVLHPKTGKPVGGLMVEAMDRDVHKHDLLGTAVTDDQGRFSIPFLDKDFKESGEKEPEIELHVGLDRRILLHVTEQPVTAKKGEETQITISLPESRAADLDFFTQTRERLAPARLRRANETALRARLEAETLEAAGAAVQGLLQAGIKVLEGRLKKGKERR
jgi:hypothetical protein